MKIKDVMTKFPETVEMNASVLIAKDKMRDFNCHHLPVLDGDKLVGVISDRDVLLVELAADGLNRSVHEVMTEDAYAVDPETDIRMAVEEMLEERIHSMIVQSKDGLPWGIFTSTDALRYITELPEDFSS